MNQKKVPKSKVITIMNVYQTLRLLQLGKTKALRRITKESIRKRSLYLLPQVQEWEWVKLY